MWKGGVVPEFDRQFGVLVERDAEGEPGVPVRVWESWFGQSEVGVVFGAVYLLQASTGAHPVMNAHQVLVAMVTITLFMPCIATLFMIARELGNKAAVAMTLFIFPFAFLVGGLVHRLGALIGL